jgi:hypothetical protein
MDRKQRLIKTLLTAVAATVAVVAAQPAAAADLQASGTAQATSLVFTDVRSADGNTIIEVKGVKTRFTRQAAAR